MVITPRMMKSYPGQWKIGFVDIPISIPLDHHDRPEFPTCKRVSRHGERLCRTDMAVIINPANMVPAMPDAANMPVRFPISSGRYQDPMIYCTPEYVDASIKPWKNRTAQIWPKLCVAAQHLQVNGDIALHLHGQSAPNYHHRREPPPRRDLLDDKGVRHLTDHICWSGKP